MADINIKVNIDNSQPEKTVAELRKEIKDLNDNAKIKLDVDDSKVDDIAADIRKYLDDINQSKLLINVDNSQALSAVNTLKTNVQSITDTQVDITVDNTQANKSISDVDKNLDNLNNDSNIKINVDDKDAQKSIEDLKDDVKDIKVDINVDTEVEKTVGDLKQEFRDLTKELNNATIGSEQYYETLKKLGSVRADIADLKGDIKELDPGERLQAFGSIAQGLVGGFAAATGAIAVFGGENENLQKSLLKVQGALTALAGVQGVLRAIDDGKRIFGAFSAGANQANTSIGKLWATLKANPMGLILTAITAVVTALSLFSSSTEDAAESQERLNKAVDNYNKGLTRAQSVTESNIILRRKEAEAAGASATELQKIDQELAQSRAETAKKSLDAATNLQAETKKIYVQMVEDGKSQSKIDEFEKNQLRDAAAKRLDAEAQYNIALNNIKIQRTDFQISQNKKAEADRQKADAKAKTDGAKRLAEEKRLTDEQKKIREDYQNFITAQQRDGLTSSEAALVELEKLFTKIPQPTDEQKKQFEDTWNLIYGRIKEEDASKIKEYQDRQLQAVLDTNVILAKSAEDKYKAEIAAEENRYKKAAEVAGLSQEEIAKITEEGKQRIKEIQTAYDQSQLDAANAANQALAQSNQQRYEAERERIQSEADFRIENEILTAEQIKAIREQANLETSEARQSYYESEMNDTLSKFEFEKASFSSRKQFLAEQEQQITSDVTLNEEQRTALLRANTDARIKIDEEAAKAREKSLATVSNALMAFSTLAGEQTSLAKGLAVAGATVDTFRAATGAYAALSNIGPAGPVLGALAAAAAVASGIANVKKILATKVPGGKDKGGATPTATTSSAGPSVTSFNPAQFSSFQNQNIQPVQTQQGATPVVVTTTNITNAQANVEVTESRAVLGG